MRKLVPLIKLYPKTNGLHFRSLCVSPFKFFSEKNEKITIDEKDSHEDFKPKNKAPQETNFEEIFSKIDAVKI